MTIRKKKNMHVIRYLCICVQKGFFELSFIRIKVLISRGWIKNRNSWKAKCKKNNWIKQILVRLTQGIWNLKTHPQISEKQIFHNINQSKMASILSVNQNMMASVIIYDQRLTKARGCPYHLCNING